MKSGNFYITLNDDAIVMHKVTSYKINNSSNFIKLGFPISTLDKVMKLLNDYNINYIVVDNEIIFKSKFENNKYDEYINNEYEIILNRINKITSILQDNINNQNIKTIINQIEDILYKMDS